MSADTQRLSQMPEHHARAWAGSGGQDFHVAVIMDGNGRWAKQKHRPRLFGHHAGVEALRRTIKAAIEEGITHLTIYAFSTENWARPAEEVSDLFGLLCRFVGSDLKKLDDEGVRIRFLGNPDRLPSEVRAHVADAEAKTCDNKRFSLQVALNYGAQADIIEAVKAASRAIASGNLLESDLTPARFSEFLSTHDLPAVDLLIRTSGEQRLSNFLLWECAYTEFVFQDVLWPDYDHAHLRAALDQYAMRDRRFGGIGQVDSLANAEV